jgi:hypothetical protein
LLPSQFERLQIVGFGITRVRADQQVADKGLHRADRALSALGVEQIKSIVTRPRSRKKQPEKFIFQDHEI